MIGSFACRLLIFVKISFFIFWPTTSVKCLVGPGLGPNELQMLSEAYKNCHSSHSFYVHAQLFNRSRYLVYGVDFHLLPYIE